VTASGILWLGLLEGPSGYADEGRAFLRALEAAGHEPAARALLKDGGDAHLPAAEQALLARQLERPAAPGAVAVHHYAPAWVREIFEVDGVPNVARTMFETDRIPVAWLPALVRRDEVWVPSGHGRAAFERGGIASARLRVVPGTMDFATFAPDVEPLALDAPDGHTVFLSNFAFSERKAWRELLAAWARAFDPADPVCLVLKTSAPKGAGALRTRVEAEIAAAARAAGRATTAPVRLMTDTLAPGDLARLYAAADAYVLASRGEGWGRPYMEALAMGLPTIASNWSGNLEFMRPETSWLVDGELVDVPAHHDTFADDVDGHRWFSPDVDVLAAALTEIAGDVEAARRRAAPAREQLIREFGPAVIAGRIADAVAEVTERSARLDAGGRSVLLRGLYGRNESLAHVNDRLLDGLEAGGRRVVARTPHALHESGDAITLSHSWPPDFTPVTDGPTAVILPWEYGDAPIAWVDRVRREVDLVVVPSAYVKDGYARSGIPAGSIEVVPNGYDPERFRPDGPRFELPGQAGCTFLFVGGTIWRKGIDVLMSAWRCAFTPDDDVQLVIKDFGADTAYRTSSKSDAVRVFAQMDGIAPVHYLGERLSPDALPALYRAADVLVHPYRGEGFGMPILEAMACGVPPIHTSIGPSQEFVGADEGWAVAACRVPIPPDPEWPLVGPGYAHECDISALVTALRAAAADPAERARRGAAAATGARAFTWSHAAARMESALSALTEDALAPVRTVARPQLEARATVVAYAPDWDDEATWSAALDRWAHAVAADADVTLALAAGADEAEAVAERVLGRLAALGHAEDALGDLVLHASDDAVAELLTVAGAVLVDDALPAPLVRRRR
jgi:glycosyltransferase involved in cell wall biosynthesis